MELVVQAGESLFLDRSYLLLPSTMQAYIPPQSLLRDSITLWIMSTAGALLLYFSVATLIYYTYFDRELMKHAKMLPNQIGKEMRVGIAVINGKMAFWQAFWGPLFMLPFWLPEINGYSLIYHDVSEYGIPYLLLSIVLFTLFSDCLIYFIHRGIHSTLIQASIIPPCIPGYINLIILGRLQHHSLGLPFIHLMVCVYCITARIRPISSVPYLPFLFSHASALVPRPICRRPDLDL
jgi:hypothetical protein